MFWFCSVSANLVGVIESSFNIGDTLKFGDSVGYFLIGSSVIVIYGDEKIKIKSIKGDKVNPMDLL